MAFRQCFFPRIYIIVELIIVIVIAYSIVRDTRFNRLYDVYLTPFAAIVTLGIVIVIIDVLAGGRDTVDLSPVAQDAIALVNAIFGTGGSSITPVSHW